MRIGVSFCCAKAGARPAVNERAAAAATKVLRVWLIVPFPSFSQNQNAARRFSAAALRCSAGQCSGRGLTTARPDPSHISYHGESQKLDTGEALEEAYIPSVAARQCKCVEQAWYAIIEHRSIITACLVSERAGDPALARAGFPGDQEVVSPPDPVAGRELGEQRLVETARRLRVEILDGGGLPEVGKLEPA